MNDPQSPNGRSASVQLPPGWKAGWSDQYKEEFYVNVQTGQSQWEHPSELPAPDNAPPSYQNNGYNGTAGYSDKIPTATSTQMATPDHSDKIPVQTSASELPANTVGNNYHAQEMDSGLDTRREDNFLSDFEFEQTTSTQTQSGTSNGWCRSKSCRVTVKRFSRIDKEDLARADREITALGSLSDPAIPPILEVFDTPDIRFLVLETRTDQSLKQYIESQGPVPEDLLKALMTQMFAGMAAIFMAGLTHLRICDETIFIDKSGSLTFKDFHYAHVYDKEVDGRQYALVQAKYGSDIYVAPEVFATINYNGRKASLWSCGVAIYYMATGQIAKLSGIEHPTNDNMPAEKVTDSPSSSRRQSTVEGQSSPRRLSLAGRKLSLSSPPSLIPYPGTTRFDVPSYARDIISKLLLTHPLKRAELIEVAAKVPKEIITKTTRPLMELAWLDYKTHVGPLAGLIDTGENVDSSASSVFSGVSKMSNPFGGLLSSRRRSSVKNTVYETYVER